MKKRYIQLIIVLLATVIAESVFCIRCVQDHRHANIDEWSGDLTILAVEHAQAARGYGNEKVAYNIPAWEYGELLELLEKTVTEENASRAEHLARVEGDYRLALQYNGRLWVFQCCEDGWVNLGFEDVITAAYYGCKDKPLHIDSSELWNYIVDTVDAKGIPVDVKAN